MDTKNKIAIFMIIFFFSSLTLSLNQSNTSLTQINVLNQKPLVSDDQNRELMDSLEIKSENYVQEGNPQKISLFNSRGLEFKNQSTDSEGITVSNPVNGWNMTSFSLNFKNISTSEKYVKFETRNDGSISFRQDEVYFAMSFKIPNSCILRNISLFVQYPGGRGSQMGDNKSSKFSISIYNATYDSNQILPNQNLTKVSYQTHFDLTDKNVTQPAKWYEANFDERSLNISETENNTFFAVFKSIKFPTSVFGSPDGYFYYADDQAGDLYNMTFYQSIGDLPDNESEERDNKNGMLKVNLAPMSTKPTPDEVNLTVFGNAIGEDNSYDHQEFIEHIDNQFDIPIASEWFAPVEYNVTFSGKFKYNKMSETIFKTTQNYIVWNSTSELKEFPSDSNARIARYYNPSYWNYNQTYKDFSTYSSIDNKSKYVDISGVSNNHNWTIQYLQKNNIINTSIFESQNKDNWSPIGDSVNFTNYVKVINNFNNTNGKAHLQVSVDDKIDIINTQNVSVNETIFPIWRPDLDTSIQNNESIIKINILTYNGSIAGILTKSLKVQVFKEPVSLILESNIKNQYVWDDTINLRVLLKSGNNSLKDQEIIFKINEIYSEQNMLEKTFSDITNNEGFAQIEYEVSQVNQLEINIMYNGTLYYQTEEILKSNITIRSPTTQLLINITPLLVIGISLVGIFSAYYIVKRRRLKEKQKIWEKKTNMFSDTLSIDYILIINKLSGSNIVQKELGDMHFEAGLVSGFLQAITSFKYELKKEKAAEKARETILLDYQDYKILLKDGEYIRVALVLSQEPSENLKKSLTKFISAFEKKYNEKLKKFDGEVSVFKNFMDLVNTHFNTSLLKPHIVNENPPPLEISSFEKKVLKIGKTIQEDQGDFYISKLLNYLLSAMPEEPKQKIIAAVYDLAEKKYLLPVPLDSEE